MCSLFNISILLSPSSIGKQLFIISILYYYEVCDLNTILFISHCYPLTIKFQVTNFIKVYFCYYTILKLSTMEIYALILLGKSFSHTHYSTFKKGSGCKKNDIVFIWIYLYKSYHILLGLVGRSWTKILWSPVSTYIPWCQACACLKAWKPFFPIHFGEKGTSQGRGGTTHKGKRGEVVPTLLSGNITHIHKLPKLLMTKSSKEDSELIRTL